MRLRLFNSTAAMALCLTVLLLTPSAAVRAQGMEPSVLLHSFSGSDGSGPCASLIQGKDGDLYGTAQAGAVNYDGTAFKVKADGSHFTLLHSFGLSSTDGASPYAGLIQGKDGDLYGTTQEGGASGDGTVFKLKANGAGYTILHNFSGSDGASPYAGLIQGKDGDLYGTTQEGGASGDGTVFKLKANGSGYIVLHSFTGPDGHSPYASLIQGEDGSLYGTTASGGAFIGSDPYGLGFGTVFKLNTDGSNFTLLHSFSGPDGYIPRAGLIQGTDGSLYSTTQAGGAYFTGATHNLGAGTVFKINPDGSSFTLLYSFTGAATDGSGPIAGLVQGKDGSLYGTTNFGDTMFALNTDGSNLTLLHSFSGSASDGGSPVAGLIEGEDGNLYGTTQFGGENGDGTIFRVGPAAASYSPKVLATNSDTLITLTGSGFASNDTVYWNSNALSTTYVSSTQLQATVPEYLLSPTSKDFITVGDPNINNNSNTLVTRIGVPQLNMSVPAEVHQNRNGSVTVKLTLANAGTAPAFDVTLNSVFLGTTPASSGTGNVGTIRNGSSIQVFLTFPAGVPLGSETFAVAGSYTPVGFSGSYTIQVLAH